jgi:hypothetical protein
MGRGEKFPPLDDVLERSLQRRFEAEIEDLEELLGRDLSVWRRSLAQASTD